MKTLKRKDYLDGKVSHEDYYGQFVNDNVKRIVLSYIKLEDIKNSTDEHMNDIPLCKWDQIKFNNCGITKKMEEAGDYLTLAGIVCIAKYAARMIKAGA